MKGIAYIGAVQALEEKGVLKGIKRVAGTSAGAIMALLCALGHSITEIADLMTNMDFGEFADGGFLIEKATRLTKKNTACILERGFLTGPRTLSKRERVQNL